ncbi:hypothetical protein ScPMuIL_002583 [Solemya velum]
MAAPMLICVCHIVQSTNDPIIAVRYVSWQRICDCVDIWVNLDWTEKEIATHFDHASRDKASYHRGCYRRFTDNKCINQGLRRKDKEHLRPAELVTDGSSSEAPPKKASILLRSNISMSVSRRSQHVLPEECIICQQSKCVVDKNTRKRKAEKLVTCETDADKLLQAAKLKGDDRILVQIALATKQLQRKSDVPLGFRRNVFTTLVWDNNDFGEETLSGKGTTHNTNGIIIQTAATDAPSNSEKTTCMSRDRKRTIVAPQVIISPLHAPKRSEPVQFKGEKPDLSRKLDIQKQPKLIDEAILLAKASQIEVSLPGWTGCNQLLSKDSHPLSVIGYLPVIDASPTDKSTVNAILEKSLDIVNSLNVSAVVLVMDQAI